MKGYSALMLAGLKTACATYSQVPVPIRLDGFGQTHNYFTSWAPKVNREIRRASCSALSGQGHHKKDGPKMAEKPHGRPK
jgi:hypothetical protein